MRVFLDALARLGVWAACPERSRLVWQDAKISGQAFAYRRDRVLHHGTLLLDSDLSALQSALEPCPGWFDSAAVASQPMRVTNLKLPEAAVIDALIESATRQFALTPAPAAPAPWLLTLEADWDWTYGRTPAFSWRKPAGIGQPPVELRVERGRWVGWGGDGSEPLALPAAGLALRAPAWTDWLTTLPTADRVRVTGLFSEGELPPD
jgi:lipoate-protein ligase A